ncbi:MAG: hypothetical protein WD766_12345 [Gemmatimonadota bacterium]
MPKIYHAAGPGVRLAEALGADGDLRSQLSGDVHLVSLDGRAFYPFSRRPAEGDYDTIKDLIDDDVTRPMDYSRGIVDRAMGGIEEIEVE